MRYTTRKHRKSGPALTKTPPHYFRPQHCAGDGCTHNHAGASTILSPDLHLFRSPHERKSA